MFIEFSFFYSRYLFLFFSSIYILETSLQYIRDIFISSMKEIFLSSTSQWASGTRNHECTSYILHSPPSSQSSSLQRFYRHYTLDKHFWKLKFCYTPKIWIFQKILYYRHYKFNNILLYHERIINSFIHVKKSSYSKNSSIDIS